MHAHAVHMSMAYSVLMQGSIHLDMQPRDRERGGAQYGRPVAAPRLVISGGRRPGAPTDITRNFAEQ